MAKISVFSLEMIHFLSFFCGSETRNEMKTTRELRKMSTWQMTVGGANQSADGGNGCAGIGRRQNKTPPS